jgi:D-galactarolactone cycloisomerase
VKISSIEAHALSVPLPAPSWTAHEVFSKSSFILVVVRTDDGLVGYGEVHGEPMPVICEWIARFGEIVKGMDALGHVEVWERLFSLTSPRPGGIQARDGLPPPLPRSARGHIMAAIGGIDIALWDIKGKAAGLPVYKLLGGVNRPIFAYATGGFYREGAASEDYGDELASFVAAGFGAVKLKCCAWEMDAEVSRIRTVREAIGPEPLLLLDMNAPYGVEECIRFAKAVEPYGIYWLEEPLHWYLQPADFAKLAAATSIPLAHGEREFTRFTVRDFMASGALRYVQFDSTRYGGFTEALRVAYFAEQCGVRIAPHVAPELHAHLCAAFSAVSFGVETIGNPATRSPLWHGIYQQRPQLKDGYLQLEETPGFGIDVDWEFVRRHLA